jgi:D-glycero-alpha-D-manno-heptose-7-phosphate kinase
LAGGTLDIWPLGLLHAGARTVNVAVSLPVTATLTRRRDGYRVRQGEQEWLASSPAELLADPATALVGTVVEALAVPPVDIHLESASPRGAGLGASSAMTVALIAAARTLLALPAADPNSIAALARDLEARLMSLPTGRQDHFPALLGGALEIRHQPGGEEVRSLAADLAELGAALVVVYTGTSHFSAGSNWQIVRRRLDGERRLVELLDGIAEAATAVSDALERGDLSSVGAGMSRDWELRRQLADGISTTGIEQLLTLAGEQGAWGGKACGAGAGGSVALLVPPSRKAALQRTMAANGGRVIDCLPTAAGLEIEES